MALNAIWCADSGNESQRTYSRKLHETISEIFAPKEAVPVVQCMNSYKPVHSVSAETAKALVSPLWTKPYSPYEHQYQSWKALLEEQSEQGKPMSICVTTGTGSGKTECFMMPLVRDLTDHRRVDEIQALFLYPLNALMEDQKSRLEELLEGTNLTYTVYNGDLPEEEPKAEDFSDNAERLRKRIRMIRGVDETTGEVKYKHMVYTRKMVRKNPPNILLTNPTMLEYILLRGADAHLINPAMKSLRWIAIDETHTYTGAGAAELAMLLRRVILAFGVKAEDLRFATSSATFGNGNNPEEDERKLKEFIAGIAGIHTNQVKAINGERMGREVIPEGEDKARWLRLFDEDFVSLGELFPGNDSVEKKLELLDDMCARVPLGKDNNPLLKAKVHYFFRIPNNGLFVRLTEHEEGAFRIYTRNSISEDTAENPMLELCRCKRCGEYVALAQIENTPGDDFHRYHALERDDSDIFDLEDEEETDKKYAIIALTKGDNARGDNNISMVPEHGHLITDTEPRNSEEWHLVVNTHCCCPCCNSKLTRKKESTEPEEDGDEEVSGTSLTKFRTSADFISRIMAPSILNNLEMVKDTDSKKMILHDGQQFISFADSRQLAAKATLKQNLEQERAWFYSIIYHELCRRSAKSSASPEEIAALKRKRDNAEQEGDFDLSDKITRQLRTLMNGATVHINWSDIAETLKRSKYCKVFCSQFVKRSGDSEELDADGNIPKSTMDKYIYSIMVMYLSNRPVSAAAPETMGLFCTYYPQIEKIELPAEVETFNQLITREDLRISKKDWHDFIQVYMDYTVRSNQSLFLKLSEGNPLDIFACKRFAIEKPRRRPVNKPTLEPNRISNARVVRYLCKLLVMDRNGMISEKDAYTTYYRAIADVMEAMWQNLTADESKLLEYSEHWNSESGQFERDREAAFRFNLSNLCFKLYDDVYLCDTNTASTMKHVKCLRPISTHFKCFAPYLSNSTSGVLDENLHEKWAPYPYYEGSGKRVTLDELKEWAKMNRKLLWEHELWGENGCFSNRLNDLHLMPNLFIQAEHTAQVDKDISRTLQDDFKEHTINILACSTTMEMGVDLGNLEVVLMSSVPPQPANYKQRAGRSGRNNKVKSVCITLCNSDAIGLRTLYNPISSIINRPVQVPMVDLMSPQVIQRHVNSYLIRSFGVFSDGDKGGKLTQKVFNYYSPFDGQKDRARIEIIDPATNVECSPVDMLGHKEGTMYEQFNERCMQRLPDDVHDGLKMLLDGTVFDGHVDYVVAKAHEANERCYQELNTKLEDIRFAFQKATNPKFRTKLKMQYYEIMLDRLLNYWATNRFTPNANMPVNVLKFDLNSTGKKSFFNPTTSSNPSYGLRDAIAQYAPGNNIVVDGVAYIVRGIQFTDMYQGVNVFKQIYRNSEKCVINDPTIDAKIRWQANEREGLELVQPVGFVPDMNEDMSRIMDDNQYTHVNAQLIDTTDWSENVTEPHLFSVRSNRDTGDARILYYNEGLGYGYCLCSKCGRMTLETEVADSDAPLDRLPIEMNTRKPKEDRNPKYHYEIFGKDFRKRCVGSNDRTSIRRNIIIGDLVQTDFSEIRIRHKGQKKWINNRSEENLMFTLGIVFTQALLDILGKERGAVDFSVMPNGHLCIFDTNPGGAGYANQMTSVPLMKEIINAAKAMLLDAKARNSKDLLLNKFTLRYIEKLDIDLALSWITEEEESRSVVPDDVAFVSPDSSETSIVNLRAAFNTSDKESILFVSDDYSRWDYEGEEHGWRSHFMNSLQIHDRMTTLCVLGDTQKAMPEPILEMLRAIKGGWAKDTKWMTNPYADKDIYPIAYIDGILYFTNNVEFANLDDTWGNGTLYCARIKDISGDAKSIDCTYKDHSRVFKLEGDQSVIMKTTELGAVIQQQAAFIIEPFLADCKAHPEEKMSITYQDEHLKSVMGMVLTLQTIAHFVKQAGNPFELEFLLERYEGTENKTNICMNLTGYAQRDAMLNDLTIGWLNELDGQHIHGELTPIQSKEKNALTHWRELAIECAGQRLSIYPDGGFVNGWNMLKDWTINTKRYDLSNTDTSDVITLKRCKDIKYDVTVENI
jgi:hypothetical protein